MLPSNQKKYFDELIKYASTKPNAKTKEAKFHIAVGVGNSPYVKLVIRRNTLIACFKNEDSGSKDIKKGDVSIKTKDTEIKVVDETSFVASKHMIDDRVGKKTSPEKN